jgi:spermidine/putrescine transport system permease protein
MLTFLPLASPEVVLGAALLALFLTMNVATGFVTIVIAHVMFSMSYVVVTVKARLEGMDRFIEEAAMDLGANEWTTFRKITLPLIAPGLAAAGLLAFVLSLDDFVITNFNAGETQTFPLFIWGAARQGVPPQVNVIATALLLLALALMFLNLVVQRRRAAADLSA